MLASSPGKDTARHLAGTIKFPASPGASPTETSIHEGHSKLTPLCFSQLAEATLGDGVSPSHMSRRPHPPLYEGGS